MGAIVAIYKGKGIRGALDYVMDPSKAAVDTPEYASMRRPTLLDRHDIWGMTPREMARSFGEYRALAGPGKDVFNIAFSWRNEECPSSEVRAAYIRDWFNEMGMGECPRIVAEHLDAAHRNDHAVGLYLTESGERVHQGWDWVRSNKICARLDERYGLRAENRTRKKNPAPNPELPVIDTPKPTVDTPEMATGALDVARLNFETALTVAKACGSSWAALRAELEVRGYELVAIRKKSGEMQGIGVRTDGHYFAASDLNRSWSYQQIQKKHGIGGDIDARAEHINTPTPSKPDHQDSPHDPGLAANLEPVARTPGRRSPRRPAKDGTQKRRKPRRERRAPVGSEGGMGRLHQWEKPHTRGEPFLVAIEPVVPALTVHRFVGGAIPSLGSHGEGEARPEPGGGLAVPSNALAPGWIGPGQAPDPTPGIPVRRDSAVGGGEDAPSPSASPRPVSGLAAGDFAQRSDATGDLRGRRGGSDLEAGDGDTGGRVDPGPDVHAPGEGPDLAASICSSPGSMLDDLAEDSGGWRFATTAEALAAFCWEGEPLPDAEKASLRTDQPLEGRFTPPQRKPKLP